MTYIPRNPTGPRVLWVTGAGSGMGRAAARAAAGVGYPVALSGRRAGALEAVAREITDAGGVAGVYPLDVTDAAAIDDTHTRISAELGTPTGLVLSAGLNDPKRYWHNQELPTFAAIVQTNLVAAAAVVDAALPGMRAAGGGVVVFISSYSGWRFSPDAGVAYSASKTAVSALAETLNAQENRHGIRACNLCPGDVDSDFLAMRPVVPDVDARGAMLSPDDVAAAVRFVLDAPPHVCINELVITPTETAA